MLRPPLYFLRRPGHGAPWHRWARAAVVVALCTAVSELMTPHFDLANIIMVYLAGVVYIALHDGEAVSIAAVIASIFLFDLIFVPPRWGLNPLNPSHFFTFAVMLLVGLLISRLAAWARRQTELAEVRAQRAQALSSLAGELGTANSPAAVAQAVTRAVQRTFGKAASVRLGGGDQVHASWSTPLQAASGGYGHLVLDSPVSDLTDDDLDLLAAFGDQAALALERCDLEEKSARALVAAESERLRNTLLSGISHDFRTPLTTIVGAATTLMAQDQQLDAARRAALTAGILQEARRLHTVMSDLLDLTRLEEGAVKLNLEWCPADDLVTEAIGALGERTLGRQLVMDVPEDAIVWCDPRLVEQAITNFVENALRYAPEGAVTVRVRQEPGASVLAVEDEGPGLPAGDEQQVFRKFQRGRLEPSGSGFGLGLAICAAVARLHGGSVTAHNRPQGGACFTLSLPQPERSAPLAENLE